MFEEDEKEEFDQFNPYDVYKKGNLFKKKNMKIKEWKKRYAVLTRHCLKWYKNQDCTKKIKGIIEIDDIGRCIPQGESEMLLVKFQKLYFLYY